MKYKYYVRFLTSDYSLLYDMYVEAGNTVEAKYLAREYAANHGLVYDRLSAIKDKYKPNLEWRQDNPREYDTGKAPKEIKFSIPEDINRKLARLASACCKTTSRYARDFFIHSIEQRHKEWFKK